MDKFHAFFLIYICEYIYMCVYIYIYTFIYTCIYIYLSMNMTFGFYLPTRGTY